MAKKTPPMRDFAHSLPMALLTARESVMSRFRPNLRSHELTEQQWRVLRVLVESAPLEVTQLAKDAFILSPSLSRILTTLEKKALIQRTIVESDQRRSVIRISKKGLKLFKVVAAQSEKIYTEIEATIGRGKMSELLLALEHVTISLE